jgi:hypothetical protein
MAMGMGTAMSMLDMRLVITDCSGKMEVIAKDTALPGNLLTLHHQSTTAIQPHYWMERHKDGEIWSARVCTNFE